MRPIGSHASELHGRSLLGRRRRQLIPFARFADVPVLTKPAAEIAAGCAKGEHASSRQKMVKWFFLDGVDAEPAAAAIGSQDDLVIQTLSNKAETTLAFVQLAKTRT
jgi:hypothetical protein